MNKSELVSAIAEGAGITKAVAAKALDSFIVSVADSLKKGEPVTLVGFGTFYVGFRAERKGRNPKTGQPIVIKASKTPKFRAGKSLKDAV